MGNTGIKRVDTLKEVEPPYPPGTPTGNTKPNVEGDPDYIAPYEDLVACPISFDTTCPNLAASGGVGQVEYEVYIPTSVAANPNVAKIKIKIMSGVTEVTSVTVNIPFSPSPNYTADIITSVAIGVYTIDTEYLNSADVIQETCTGLATVEVS